MSAYAVPAENRDWIKIAGSAIDGRGVYARKNIPDGSRILEYTGELITKAEARRREQERLARQQLGGDSSVYIFTLNKRHDLDGRTRRNIARLINHSCAPNCRVQKIRGRIWIVARRDIEAGEELTFDYGFSFTEWPKHPCRCGSDRCPGFIVAKEQRWRLRRIPRRERIRKAAEVQVGETGKQLAARTRRH
jgi:uncharacterized protein